MFGLLLMNCVFIFNVAQNPLIYNASITFVSLYIIAFMTMFFLETYLFLAYTA